MNQDHRSPAHSRPGSHSSDDHPSPLSTIPDQGRRPEAGNRLGLHHSVALLYLRTLPSVPSLTHSPTAPYKARRKKRVMVARALMNHHHADEAAASVDALASTMAATSFHGPPSRPSTMGRSELASSKRPDKPSTLDTLHAAFLHSQSQAFPDISSDETTTITSSVSSCDGRTASRRGVDSDTLRTLFAASMSSMYKSEVPLYGDLIQIVADVNAGLLRRMPGLVSEDEISRLDVERHGAMRVGTAEELNLLARIFRVLGMQAVGYYDLWNDAGLPIHSTAFRPVGEAQLMKNPFRVFCSLLRIELIGDPETRQLAETLLSRRQIASPRCFELLEKLEASIRPISAPVDEYADDHDDLQLRSKPQQQHEDCMGPHYLDVAREEALEFIEECLQIFKWHSDTTVSKADYERLKRAHPLVADIVSFRGPHINHLTPRTLDIDQVQREMNRRGMDAKEIVEGPPSRRNPIYLRQTSFHALSEQISFADPLDSSARVLGHHTARFGEIEQRGQALTGKGADLYDEVMRAVNKEKSRIELTHGGRRMAAEAYTELLQREFKARFTDDAEAIRKQGLGFFRYRVVWDVTIPADADEEGETGPEHATLLDRLLRTGAVVAEPIVFEDFLPASAAGIFQSNLAAGVATQEEEVGTGGGRSEREEARKAEAQRSGKEARDRLQSAVGRKLLDPFELYRRKEVASLKMVAKVVGLEAVVDLF